MYISNKPSNGDDVLKLREVLYSQGLSKAILIYLDEQNPEVLSVIENYIKTLELNYGKYSKVAIEVVNFSSLDFERILGDQVLLLLLSYYLELYSVLEFRVDGKTLGKDFWLSLSKVRQFRVLPNDSLVENLNTEFVVKSLSFLENLAFLSEYIAVDKFLDDFREVLQKSLGDKVVSFEKFLYDRFLSDDRFSATSLYETISKIMVGFDIKKSETVNVYDRGVLFNFVELYDDYCRGCIIDEMYFRQVLNTLNKVDWSECDFLIDWLVKNCKTKSMLKFLRYAAQFGGGYYSFVIRSKVMYEILDSWGDLSENEKKT